MREREPHNLATTAAEAMYNLWEMESQQGEPDLDAMMRHLKDLSAYSLTHAEILQQREGVELLALAMFFGATSDPAYHENQARLQQLSEEAVSYEGRPEKIEKEMAQRKEKRQAEGEPEITAEQLLQRCRAHELMRQVQKTLLDGEGRLQFYEDVGGYQRAVVLMWKGPISDASKPATIEDVEGSIIVGATDDGVFVNDSELSEVSPEALRQALLELAREFVTAEKA